MTDDAVVSDRPTILFVDDERRIGALFERLVGNKAEIETASTAREAWELMVANRYDAIVCDLHMPQISGSELYERLCDEMPELASQVVFITGGLHSEKSRQFAETVDNPTIFKPFDLVELQSALSAVMGREFEI